MNETDKYNRKLFDVPQKPFSLVNIFIYLTHQGEHTIPGYYILYSTTMYMCMRGGNRQTQIIWLVGIPSSHKRAKNPRFRLKIAALMQELTSKF